MAAEPKEMFESNNEFVKNFIFEQLDDDYKDLLVDCKYMHKPEILLTHCLKKLDFNQIVFQSYLNKRKETCFKPWFYITGFASAIGYTNARDVKNKYLKDKNIKKVKELASLQTGDLLNLAVLPQNKVNDLGLTDYEGAKYLIDHVAHSNDSRFKPAAKEMAKRFQLMMNKIQVITGDVIDLLNHALVQQQLQLQQQRILQLEAPKANDELIYKMACEARERESC